MLRYVGMVTASLSALAVACAKPVSEPPCTPAPSTATGRFRGVEQLLQSCVEDRAFPGAVLYVGSRDTIIYRTAVGSYGQDDPRPVSNSTVYDLASLTKVIGLTTAVMVLVSDGVIDIDSPLSSFLPELADLPKGRITVRQLLTHTSGLPAWRPLHLETASREEALDSVLAARLESTPGERYVYSDLGAITLGLVVERLSGQGLDQFLNDRAFGPLGMQWTRYLPPAEWTERIAPTEDDPWRGRVLKGEVHDENAARLGGIAGHAGLFSIAPDLARFAQWILSAYGGSLEPDDILQVNSATVRKFVTRQPGPDGLTRALGWDTPSDEGSSAGTLLSRSSFGHTGFTGTSIWIDPERDLFIILLTNRVHPTRENNAIGRIRGAVADSVVVAVGR